MTRVLSFLLLVGCGPLNPETAQTRLQRAVERQANKDPIHNVVLRVDAPSLGISGTWAGGQASPAVAMTSQTPFLTASVGKLFTAAAVVALANRGELSLDDPVTRWVAADTLSNLPIGGGDDALDRLTVAHLLGHRSGLPDYFDGTARGDVANVFKLMTDDPDRGWTRAELLNYASAHFDAVGAPGEQFTYADTNYDLLGMVLEGVVGQPWHVVVHDEVIAPVGLRHTWHYNLVDAPQDVPAIAGAYIGESNMTGRTALTADQAGGGLATTAEDLGIFLRSLEDGVPIARTDLELYTEDGIGSGLDYGYGLWRIRPGTVSIFLSGSSEMVGVSGATGSFAYYVPEHDAVITGTFNQTEWQERHIRFLLAKVLPVVQNTER